MTARNFFTDKTKNNNKKFWCITIFALSLCQGLGNNPTARTGFRLKIKKMKTIEIRKRGYDYISGEDWINVPYMAKKNQIVGYIKAIFGVDAFVKYRFIVVTK